MPYDLSGVRQNAGYARMIENQVQKAAMTLHHPSPLEEPLPLEGGAAENERDSAKFDAWGCILSLLPAKAVVTAKPLTPTGSRFIPSGFALSGSPLKGERVLRN